MNSSINFINETSNRIANIKGMTLDEYENIRHEIIWRKECESGNIRNMLCDLWEALDENYISQNGKFKKGEIVRYRGRLCKVVKVEINIYGNCSRQPKGFIYYMKYVSNNKNVADYYGVHEDRLSKVNKN